MIIVENLTFTYKGKETPTLKGISFQIRKGEIFGFLGPSGAGKSTTQKVLNGILKNYSGKVNVEGTDLYSAGNSFYEDIGVSFELPNLYQKLTAIENLRLFSSFFNKDTEDPEKLLGMVGLGDDMNTRVEAFSKGMKVRLNFIRALLNNPKVLFLDEPTSGLDPVNARIMKDIILDQKSRGTTIFLTTHNMADADELCDNLAFIVDGQLPVLDSPHNLKLAYGRKVLRVEYRNNGATEWKEFSLKNIGQNQEFQSLLKEKELETIHTQEASLSEIFIKVTGKTLH